MGGRTVHRDPLAELGKLGLAREQRQRRAPIVALLHRRARHGTVGRHEKPDRLAVGEKELGLGRFVFPTHATRAAEVHGARLDLDAGASIAVGLQECGLKRLDVVVTILERTTKERPPVDLGIIREGTGSQSHKTARHRYCAGRMIG